MPKYGSDPLMLKKIYSA